MNKRKNHQLNAAQKSTVIMTGTLSLPLCIGERAWIQTGHQFFTTSMVKKIMEVSEIGIRFETCNTIYDLRYEKIVKESGVMCA